MLNLMLNLTLFTVHKKFLTLLYSLLLLLTLPRFLIHLTWSSIITVFIIDTVSVFVVYFYYFFGC